MKRSGMAVPLHRFVGRSSDVWLTPDWIAADVVRHFAPSGRVLDPCKGEGAFLRHMPGAEWCEIREGRDFFAWSEPVDWIVSNPPYSTFTPFHDHAMRLADNVVWLIPMHKPWGSWPRLMALREWGWMAHCRIYGKSRDYGLDMGFVCGAVHFKKGHGLETTFSFTANNGLERTRTRSGSEVRSEPSLGSGSVAEK